MEQVLPLSESSKDDKSSTKTAQRLKDEITIHAKSYFIIKSPQNSQQILPKNQTDSGHIAAAVIVPCIENVGERSGYQE
jgi:hypothetical protein